jgi:lipocalin
VFARDPVMDDATLAGLQERLRAYGYDPAALKRVPQTPDQLPASD